MRKLKEIFVLIAYAVAVLTEQASTSNGNDQTRQYIYNVLNVRSLFLAMVVCGLLLGQSQRTDAVPLKSRADRIVKEIKDRNYDGVHGTSDSLGCTICHNNSGASQPFAPKGANLEFHTTYLHYARELVLTNDNQGIRSAVNIIENYFAPSIKANQTFTTESDAISQGSGIGTVLLNSKGHRNDLQLTLIASRNGNDSIKSF